MSQVTLEKLINQGADLTDEQKQSLFQLVSKGVRQRNRERLWSKINHVPLACWANYGLYGRVHLEARGFEYCAGQSYPDEIRTLRELMLG